MKIATVITTAIVLILGVSVPAQAENPAHLKQLLETKQCAGCDLSGAQLAGTNLQGANLKDANLQGAN